MVLQDFFLIFQHDVNFFVDKTILRKKYLELIKIYQNSHEQNKLSLIHNAYKILNDDELRIEYFLKLWGLINHDGSSEVKLSNAFLMEMMDLNDEILTGNESAIQQTQNLLDENLKNIFQLFQKELSEETKKEIAQKYFERKYLKRLLNA